MLDTIFKLQKLREYIEKEPVYYFSYHNSVLKNAHGIFHPLFSILKSRKMLPKELPLLMITGQIQFISTSYE